MTEDRFLNISTNFHKNSDDPEILEFSVTLRETDDGDGEEKGSPLASLSGFLLHTGYLEAVDDEEYFYVFDSRSHHAMDTHRILTSKKSLVAKAIKSEINFGDCSYIAHVETLHVDPAMRGQRVGLRLLREAQHVLARNGLLIILKAHPDGDDISDADCLKLAKYYQSEKRLGLKAVSKAKEPGWLVAHWGEAILDPKDNSFLYG